MKLARTTLALLLSAALPLPALAQPHVIAESGSAPLVSPITSTPQLQADVTRQRALFEAAGTKLGLTPSEFAQFEVRISSKQLAYVNIPRHLDAMSWSSGGRVYVLRDVVIPAQTKGWEVDLQEGHQIVALYVPARCGNLSILRRPMPALARVPRPRRVAVEAAATAPPQPAAPAPAPAVEMPAPPAATAAPYQTVAASTPPAHRMGWWPLLLIPIVALLAGSHSGGGTNIPTLNTGKPPGGGGSGIPPPGPTPTPVSCVPTPAAH